MSSRKISYVLHMLPVGNSGVLTAVRQLRSSDQQTLHLVLRDVHAHHVPAAAPPLGSPLRGQSPTPADASSAARGQGHHHHHHHHTHGAPGPIPQIPATAAAGGPRQ